MKTKRSNIADCYAFRRRQTRSSFVHKRLRQLLSEFPPINFSIQPHILSQRDLWRDNIFASAPPVTKSWLPTTSRCSPAAVSHVQRPQLRHVITDPSESPIAYRYHHIRDSSTYKHCTTLYPDPFDSKKRVMEFAGQVESRGKFYATSLQGALVVMQVRDAGLVITDVGGVRAVPSVPWRFFKEYLVEMEGEILLVFLIHEKCREVVDHVEVFRVDLDKLDWVKVERMRGKTMFLKEKSVWMHSVEFGCRDDCVFFTEGSENKWRVYDMKTSCISSVLLEKCD